MTMRKRLSTLLLAACAAVALGLPVTADVPKDSAKDWPQFRGPMQNNVSQETGLLKEWPKEGPPLAWKIKGVGDGHASVAVANGKIFTSGAEGESTYVIALNESDGTQAWKTKAGGVWNNSDDQGGGGPRSTPTVDGDKVYAVGPVGEVVCLNAADGKPVWHANLKADFGGGVPHWGYSDSALVEGDKVICTPGGEGGTLVALDKNTGKEVWRTKELTDAAAYTTPVAADIGGVRQVVVYTQEHVAGIDPKNGSVLWATPRKGATAVIPTPVVKDNYVYVTSGYGIGCDLFKINNEGGKFSVEPIYTHDKNHTIINHHGGVVLLNGFVYGHSDATRGKNDGGWTCQELVSGQSKWKDSSLGKGTITYADGRFYIREENKQKSRIALIEASPDGYKEHGRFEQPNHSGKMAWPHLVIANGKLYVRDMDTLLCYDVKAK